MAVRAINDSKETFEYTFDTRYPPSWPPGEVRVLDDGEFMVALHQAEIRDESGGVIGHRIREVQREDAANAKFACPWINMGLCDKRGFSQEELMVHLSEAHGTMQKSSSGPGKKRPFDLG